MNKTLQDRFNGGAEGFNEMIPGETEADFYKDANLSLLKRERSRKSGL